MFYIYADVSRGATEDEVKMRMKGEWRWDDHEDEMKKYLTRTRRGERKRRRREHQHNTPGPERANPERAREKKSGGSTDTEQDQRRWGGRTKAPEPTWHGENLHTSRHATEPTYLGRKNAWDRGPMGTSWWNHKKEKQDSVPKYLKVVRYSLSGTVVKSCPNWHKRLSSSSEFGAQYVWPHQKPKWPHLQEEDMPVAFCRSCHVSSQKLKLQ